MPAIWDIMRLSYMGTVWDHLGHYETFSWDITRPPLKLPKIFFGRFAPSPPYLKAGSLERCARPPRVAPSL